VGVFGGPGVRVALFFLGFDGMLAGGQIFGGVFSLAAAAILLTEEILPEVSSLRSTKSTSTD
jgi:hypothetical protein